MTRRRTTISIYDYPEHLNPFREDADDGEDTKYHTTGRRRSSFRVNAWSVFAGRGKSPERSTPSPIASRFLTWTPKLLRRASFRRTISSSTQTPEHKNALSPPRTQPARPPAPTHICTPNSSPAPVPAVRTRRLAQRAGGEDEAKYIQQGAKPKKKRRAPAPPTPQPGRASQLEECETSDGITQQQPQPSGEQECGILEKSAEECVEQSGILPAAPEEPSSSSAAAVALETVATVTEEVPWQSNNSLAASEESTAESGDHDASEQLKNESATVAAEETEENISQNVAASPELSERSSTPVEEPGAIVSAESNECDSPDIHQQNSSPTLEQEKDIIASEQSEKTENGDCSANEVESPSRDIVETETSRKHVLEAISEASVEDSPVVADSPEEPPQIVDCETSNSESDVQKNQVDPEEEQNDCNVPLENGYSGSDIELSPSKYHLIDEEPKPLPKPRTILPEKPTEQDKKP